MKFYKAQRFEIRPENTICSRSHVINGKKTNPSRVNVLGISWTCKPYVAPGHARRSSTELLNLFANFSQKCPRAFKDKGVAFMFLRSQDSWLHENARDNSGPLQVGLHGSYITAIQEPCDAWTSREHNDIWLKLQSTLASRKIAKEGTPDNS
ncbi:hypothetical protein V6N13_125131 [Hibiscus sabdariffa]